MNTWFTVKVKYTKQLENGMFKRISEPYLLAAMTFTDAEARIYEELGTLIRGEFDVVGISRTELHDIFMYDDSTTWWKCKISYDSAEENSEKSKKINQTCLVSADTAKEAYERIHESMASMLVDFSVVSIIYSPLIDIFPYRENLDREIDRRPIDNDEISHAKTTEEAQKNTITSEEGPSQQELHDIEEELDSLEDDWDEE